MEKINTSRRHKNSIQKFSAIILLNVIIVIIFFIIIEGMSSIILITKNAFFENLISERKHTKYDEELGWINLPNLNMKDMYGPGNSFITNSMTFRNDKDFSLDIPANKIRIICSGDSFTMGYGVDNNDAWCNRLEFIDNRIEPVNLGQGGYGIDQSYLWYKRISSNVAHNIHIFAFIHADFVRMKHDNFVGYGKPFFAIQNGALVNTNMPVPKSSYSFYRLPKILRSFRQSNTARVFSMIFSGDNPSHSKTTKANNDNLHEIVIRIFEDLEDIGKSKNSKLVLVFLPTETDYMGIESEKWQTFISKQAVMHNFLFIDLIEEFRKVPSHEVKSLFNEQQDNHYSEKGNSYIADVLYNKLNSIPEIANKFQRN